MSSYDLEQLESADPLVVRVALGGELDLTNAGDLARSLEAAAAPEAVLVLDLNRVLFVDSAALHVLFTIARERGRDRLCIVLDPTAPIARTLEIAALADAARVGDTEDELVPPRASA